MFAGGRKQIWVKSPGEQTGARGRQGNWQCWAARRQLPGVSPGLGGAAQLLLWAVVKDEEAAVSCCPGAQKGILQWAQGLEECRGLCPAPQTPTAGGFHSVAVESVSLGSRVGRRAVRGGGGMVLSPARGHLLVGSALHPMGTDGAVSQRLDLCTERDEAVGSRRGTVSCSLLGAGALAAPMPPAGSGGGIASSAASERRREGKAMGGSGGTAAEGRGRSRPGLEGCRRGPEGWSGGAEGGRAGGEQKLH